MKRSLLIFRIRLLSFFIVTISLVLIGRLYQIQVVKSDYYQAKAESQYIHTKTDLYSRGSIFFTTKDGTAISAAAIQSGYLLAVNPEHLTVSSDEFCQKIVKYLSSTQEKCVKKISKPNRTYIELTSRVSKEESLEIQELDIDGALLYKNQWRYYPGDSLAARSIGFIGYSDTGTEKHGKYGLERQYDDVLFEKRQVMSINFFAELFSNLGEFVYKKDETLSGDIITTLEPSVSRMLDSVLLKTNDEFSSILTGAIVMDPHTGEIIAMNAVPGFDLNDRSEATIDQFRNPLVENVYEFGSTIKALTMAAGLDSGVITTESTYYDSGTLKLDGYTIINLQAT